MDRGGGGSFEDKLLNRSALIYRMQSSTLVVDSQANRCDSVDN